MANIVVKYALLGFPLASAGLGVWQIKRLDWKTNLLESLERQLKDEPIDLLAINSANELQDMEYRRVKASGKFDPDPNHQIYLKPRQLVVNEEALFRGRTAHQSNTGLNVITPFYVDGTDLRILVNRGWLAPRGKDSVENNAHIGLEAPPDGKPIEISGIVRKTDTKSTYGVKNDLTTNVWQIRDINAMARALNTAPIFVELDQDTKRTEGPYGGQTQLSVRNEHLNYAITWFSLAVFSYIMWLSRYGKIRMFKSNWR